MKDSDKMPFGIHKGKAMVNVPASYLMFLWESKKLTPEVLEYIKDNLEVIKLLILRFL